MSLSNATSLEAVDVPTIDHEGREVVLVVVKATYEVAKDGVLVLAEEPAPIRFADEPWGDEEQSSLRFASDIGLSKVGVDVLVVGEAWSPRPVTAVDIIVRAGERTVPLRVHGPRVYYEGAMGLAISPALEFERAPVRWELAYGGTAADQSIVELRNPVGVGVAKHADDLIDRPAPRIEHPERPHRSRRDEHPPVGCTPVPTHWSPRRERFGTTDSVWQSTRMPLAPMDHDLRFNNVAPAELQLPMAPAGTPFHVSGMSEKAVSFAVPPWPVLVRGRYDGAPDSETPTTIDTIIVEPRKRRVELAARVTLPIGRRRILREIIVDHAS